MNVKLLRKVQKHILEEPKRFRMDLFKITGEPGGQEHGERWNDGEVRFPKCGTMACIGGWAAILSNAKDHGHDISKTALDITEAQANRLFYDSCWPDKFRDAYEDAKSRAKRAKVAVARINHFIKTKGAE